MDLQKESWRLEETRMLYSKIYKKKKQKLANKNTVSEKTVKKKAREDFSRQTKAEGVLHYQTCHIRSAKVVFLS